MSAPPSPTPLTVQELIDRSSHCMVVDGAGTPHSAVKAKISDLRLIQVQLSESQEKLREAEEERGIADRMLQDYRDRFVAAEAALAAAGQDNSTQRAHDHYGDGDEFREGYEMGWMDAKASIRALAAPQEERGHG